MNDPNWNENVFAPVVFKLRAMGVEVRAPAHGEGPDSYVSFLMMCILEVVQPTEKARARQYYNTSTRQGKDGAANDPAVMIDHDAARLRRGEAIKPIDCTDVETVKGHVTEQSGRSYKIEGAVVDGKVIKPGEPMPPVATDGAN